MSSTAFFAAFVNISLVFRLLATFFNRKLNFGIDVCSHHRSTACDFDRYCSDLLVPVLATDNATEASTCRYLVFIDIFLPINA